MIQISVIIIPLGYRRGAKNLTPEFPKGCYKNGATGQYGLNIRAIKNTTGL
jgi:hypothetical protein